MKTQIAPRAVGGIVSVGVGPLGTPRSGGARARQDLELPAESKEGDKDRSVGNEVADTAPNIFGRFALGAVGAVGAGEGSADGQHPIAAGTRRHLKKRKR